MPIFVAGTGRSGTTRLANLLGTHPDVYTIPSESRFLVDPAGLEDLVEDLTSRYTTFHAADAVRRFSEMLRSVMQREIPYAERLDGTFSEERYTACLDGFLERITAFRFTQSQPDVGREMIVGRFFGDRSQLIGLARDFVEGLFGGARDAAGKSVWCEKTPYNLLSMPFLWELFPDAAIVHIKRDPRGVANSMARMWWAPDDIDDVIAWLSDAYRRWVAMRSSIDFEGRRYAEVRVEDLAAHPDTRVGLLETLGLADAPLEGWFGEKVNWWRLPEGMPRDWRERVEDRLGWAIEAMGYGEGAC